VKPLDLNVSIQNSYEAARVESVRLEKEHIMNRLSGEESLWQQRLRDEQVTQPEAKIMHEDLFSAEAYEAPDYAQRGDSEKRRHGGTRHTAAESVAETAGTADEGSKKAAHDQDNGSGFSSYA
jgi:hypothetical protein